MDAENAIHRCAEPSAQCAGIRCEIVIACSIEGVIVIGGQKSIDRLGECDSFAFDASGARSVKAEIHRLISCCRGLGIRGACLFKVVRQIDGGGSDCVRYLCGFLFGSGLKNVGRHPRCVEANGPHIKRSA